MFWVGLGVAHVRGPSSSATASDSGTSRPDVRRRRRRLATVDRRVATDARRRQLGGRLQARRGELVDASRRTRIAVAPTVAGATMQLSRSIASGVLGLGTALVFGAADGDAACDGRRSRHARQRRIGRVASAACSDCGGRACKATVGVQPGRGWCTTDDNLAARCDALPAGTASARLAALQPGRSSTRRPRRHGVEAVDRAGASASTGIPIRRRSWSWPTDLGLSSAAAGLAEARPPYTQPAMRFLSRFFDSNDRELKRIQPFVDRGQRARGRVRGPLRRGDPRADRRRSAREFARGRGRPRSRPRTSSTTPTSSAAATSPRRAASATRSGSRRPSTTCIPEVFAAGREAMKRTLGMRQFDVQLMGGIVLHQGKIAEMRTGEGKTLVPTLAAVLNGARRPRRARRHGQRLPRPPRRAVDGPGLPLPRACRSGVITHDTSYVFEPGFPTNDERLINLRPGHPPRGLRRGHHLRHEQRVRVRLPARQHGRHSSTAGCSASASSRSSTRSTTSSSTRRGRR